MPFINFRPSLAPLYFRSFPSLFPRTQTIHSAAFRQYPIRGVEQMIRFRMGRSPPMRDFLLEAFDRFRLAGSERLKCIPFRVGWASRLPVTASRGDRLLNRHQTVSALQVRARKDAGTGGRDAHPTREHGLWVV